MIKYPGIDKHLVFQLVDKKIMNKDKIKSGDIYVNDDVSKFSVIYFNRP